MAASKATKVDRPTPADYKEVSVNRNTPQKHTLKQDRDGRRRCRKLKENNQNFDSRQNLSKTLPRFKMFLYLYQINAVTQMKHP